MLVRILSAITAFAIAITMAFGLAGGPAQAVGRAAAVTDAPAAAAPSVAKKDLDCSDFPSQAAAQAYFLAHGGPAYDPDDLDGDGNGIACESNPCPCSTSTHQGGGGGGSGHTGGSKCTGIPPAKGSMPLHKLTAKTRKVSGGKFAVYGTISSLPHGQLSLFKAKGKNGHYCLDHKGPTQGDGDYQLTFSGPIGTCYKLVAPATSKRKETIHFVGCIVTQ